MLDLSLLYVTLGVLFFVAIGLRATASSTAEYYRFGGVMGKVDFFSVVAGSSISLGGAIIAFLGLGYTFPAVALFATATWVGGFVLHYYMLKRLDFEKIKSAKTLHQYIGIRHNSTVPVVLAAFSSTLGFAGAYGIEVVAITKLTSPIIGYGHLGNIGFVLLLSFAVGLYMHRGGLRAVVSTDKYQLAVFVLGILAVVYLLDTKFPNVKLDYVVADVWAGGQIPWMLCLALLTVNLPWQIIDMSQWQRSVSCKSISTVKVGLFASCVGITISWIVLIGLGVFLSAIDHTMVDPVAMLIDVLKNSKTVYVLFLFAALGAMYSTADSYIIAAAQCVHFDIIAISDGHSRGAVENDLPLAKKIMWVLAIVPPVFMYIFNIIIPSILDLFFIVFSAQLSMLPSVIFPMFYRGGSPAISSIVSQITGLISAFVFFLLCLNGSSDLFYVSPVFTVIISSLAYVITRKIHERGVLR